MNDEYYQHVEARRQFTLFADNEVENIYVSSTMKANMSEPYNSFSDRAVHFIC